MCVSRRSCRVMSCRVVSCRVVSCRAVSCVVCCVLSVVCCVLCVVCCVLRVTCCVLCVVWVKVVVVVVRTRCYSGVFIQTTARLHQNWGGRTPGSQTPGVPATLASTSKWTEAEKCCKTAASYLSTPPQPSLHDHRDDQSCR